ncbi:MAG: hypothetical protein PGMFKBFP_02951 [Anaerolineales bacterium]|nr:hypothetical protein [Anaerolineales bacterium]
MLRAEQPFVKGLDLLRRLDAEFALQGGGAGVIDLQRARAVVHQRAQTHGLEIGALVQRVGADETVRGFDGFLVAARLFECLRQLRQRAQKFLLKLLAHQQRPILIMPRQQLAAIVADRLLQMADARLVVLRGAGGGQRGSKLERVHVQA